VETRRSGNMTVENGLIQTHGGMGLLYWTAARSPLSDSGRLQNARHNDNSGVFIRIPIELAKNDAVTTVRGAD